MLKNKNGFTLVELLVTLGIIGISGLMFTQFLLSNMNNYYRAQDDVNAQAVAQRVADKLTQDILESSSVSAVTAITGLDALNTAPVSPVPIRDITLNKSDGTSVTYTSNSATMELVARDSANNVVLTSSNILSIKFAPLPNVNFSSAEAKGLQLTVESKVKNKTVVLKTDIYYRSEY